VLPAVDVGRSVSRVGGDAQLAAYRTVAGDLRLAYSQFQELERFARFATQLDRETLRTLEHGRRVREVLKQAPGAPIGVPEQVAVLLAVTEGLLDDLPLERIGAATGRLRAWIRSEERFATRVLGNQALDDDDRVSIRDLTARAVSAAWSED
jgi:F-type H+-transporting ATPase subunit alpha